MPKKAIIIGAGPAGLTAAYELLKRTDIIPIILEKDDIVGGISRTINYKGNRMDMGPHRFFSKSDRVMNWWLNIMPLERGADKNATISYQNKSREINAEITNNTKDPDKAMLVIQRLTRIYFLRKFFAYPIQLSFETLRTLGLIRTVKILFSFLWIRLFPCKPEKSLEDFIINKFGKELYLLFFKGYTEKVWGIAPSQISAEWGAQRIKGVSLSKAISQALKSLRSKKKGKRDIEQKGTETSLIEQFLYPKYGPGSLWEEVARQVQEMGGKLYLNQHVEQIHMQEERITSVTTINSQTGKTSAWEGDYFFSTMPVQELIAGMGENVPKYVQEVAAGLQYRDFINVGILLNQLSNKEGKNLQLKDNWIYIQERDVKVGRLMIYNNWGDSMIKDSRKIWIGMEYFCNKTDAFWAESDETIQALAIRELEKMELASVKDVLDITVRRMEKTYPAYFGTYAQFHKIQKYTDQFENLFLIGRNGMHKYNNTDHSMLCAMVAVDNVEAGITAKYNLWAINTEQEYHEEKKPIEQTISKLPIEKVSPNKSSGFKPYLFEDRLNRAFLWIAGIAIILQFIIFKSLYPYAGFINGDSYVYLESAFMNNDINTYPIGYPRFLRLFSVFTKSDTALVVVQYIFIQASALGLLFTLFFIYTPARLTRWLMFSLVVFNPVFLYISNYVSSDALFLSLSIVWFTLLLWVMQKTTIRLIVLLSIILFLSITVRYNALYYPFITAIAYLLTKQSLRIKFYGIAASFLVVGAFMLYTSHKYQELTGVRQFTPFSGWQIANNAMYAYRFVDSFHRVKAPSQYQALDKTVRYYFDTSRDIQKHPMEMLIASTVYMWDPRSPLNTYMSQKYKKDSASSRLKKWASMAPLYAGYGSYLIRQYPMTFLRYFILPNALKYYAPPGEFLDEYNMGRDTVAKIAQGWFNYRSNKVHSAFKDFKVESISFLPILSGIMNVTFILGLLAYCVLKRHSWKSPLSLVLLLTSVLWVANFGFSVFASPITLRYQLFGILIFSSFALLLLDIVYKAAFLPAN